MAGSAEKTTNIGPLANELRYIIQTNSAKKVASEPAGSTDKISSDGEEGESEDSSKKEDKAALEKVENVVIPKRRVAKKRSIKNDESD